MKSREEFAGGQRGGSILGRENRMLRGMKVHGLFMEQQVVLDGWNKGNICSVVITRLRIKCSS